MKHQSEQTFYKAAKRINRTWAERLNDLDAVDAARPLPPLLAQLIFSAIIIAAAIGLRGAINMVAEGAGPFALFTPAVLAATLFGRWQAGIVCHTVLALYAWYFVLPATGSWTFEVEGDGPRVAVNVAAGYAVVTLAELFRRAVRQAVFDRELLMHELEHRVKNSFAQIAGVLRLQMQSTDNIEVQHAVGTALGRVESFAEAYALLSVGGGDIGRVEIASYLTRLCALMEATLPTESEITICVEGDYAMVERDRATTIGLLVNEIVTNSVKHAFPGKNAGTIIITLQIGDEAGILEVADDGVGIGKGRVGSLGLKLIDGLASQLQASVDVQSSEAGTRFAIRIPQLGRFQSA